MKNIMLAFLLFTSNLSFGASQSNESILPLNTINSYRCIYRELSWQPPHILEYGKKSFNFKSGARSPFLPADLRNPVCHDASRYGEYDSPLFPRLEERQSFVLWDNGCSLCGDRDLNGVVDLNDEVTREYQSRTGQNTQVELFFLFDWEELPKEARPQQSNKTLLGVVMLPFVSSFNQSHCPTIKDYYRNNPIYQIVGDLVGIDTEGLWMAQSELQVSTRGEFLVDNLLIREGELKKVWFYFERGIHVRPDRMTSASKTIHFYYPFDFNDPYTRKPNQMMYTIRHPAEVGINTGINIGLIPPDKRFACIPKL
ncbi:MAG: hypothetical protein VXV96_06645 [Bdellovibrionota bacterium]|nr:hypothetical protein [Bdellovibrionota bacterium]